jgi:hypothetical protein
MCTVAEKPDKVKEMFENRGMNCTEMVGQTMAGNPGAYDDDAGYFAGKCYYDPDKSKCGGGYGSLCSDDGFDHMTRLCACDCGTKTCKIAEDPHISNFDGVQVSLLHAKVGQRAIKKYDEDIKWVVQSDSVSIQARYVSQSRGNQSQQFVGAVAVGGRFLNGNKMVIGSFEDNITWNGQPILEKETSSFDFRGEDELFVKAERHGNSSFVQDLAQRNQGVDVEFPLGVQLTVNRLHGYVNVAITMPPLEDGQDGLCGNMNGFGSDDSLEFISDRIQLDVPPDASLFEA